MEILRMIWELVCQGESAWLSTNVKLSPCSEGPVHLHFTDLCENALYNHFTDLCENALYNPSNTNE